MDANQVREWRARYQAVNKHTLDEKRRRSVAERLRLLQVFVDGLSAMGLLRTRPDDLEYHLRWQKLREKIQDRAKVLRRDSTTTL